MRWLALTLTLLLWAATWPQILPSHADLPPCHMMLLIGLAGTWTLIAFIRERRARERIVAESGCPACGYDLTGNTSGRCPECGCCFREEVDEADSGPKQSKP